LNPKQILFFDAMRYSVEMADLAHSRLAANLLRLTCTPDNDAHDTWVSNILDAWTVVDCIHRLRTLLLLSPGIKQNTPGFRGFQNRTKSISELRNRLQHINNEITSILENGSAILGSLTWLASPQPETRKVFSCCFVAGTVFRNAKHHILNPCDKEFRPPIDHITLTAAEHSANLSDIMRAVGAMTRGFEEDLAGKFKDLPTAGADLLMSVSILLKEDSALA
jgi:hypothetical protein